MNRLQNRAGLPDALIEEKRFFELYGPGKTDTPKGWNTPENWQYLDDIPEGRFFGFALGNNSNYLLIDGDHVRDAKTGRLVPWVADVVQRIREAGDTYTEVSMSGTGFHMICDLGDYAEDFGTESNEDYQKIIQMDPAEYAALPKEERDKVPKIELFYRLTGRYVYLTGKHDKLRQVARDEAAAEIFRQLIKIRDEFHGKFSKYTTTAKRPGGAAAPAEGARFPLSDRDRERLLDALFTIPANCDRITWVRIGYALFNHGFPFETFDEWSKHPDPDGGGEFCSKYNADEVEKVWKSYRLDGSNWSAGTIFKAAKAAGWMDSYKDDAADRKKIPLCLPEFSDVMQSNLMVQEYGSILRYSRETGFLVYTGKRWELSDLKAQKLSQRLTDRQLDDARKRLQKARARVDELIESEASDSHELNSAKEEERAAKAYRSAVVKRRSTNKIRAALTEAAPQVEVDVKSLDKDGLLLNTPSGAVDLRSGSIRENRAEDLCTKITSVGPDQEGSDTFNAFLNQITCGDEELKKYLQIVAGVFTVGRVDREELYIAIGNGGNGKSTFFNLLYMVLGDYAGQIASDVLVSHNSRNKSPELAELRGKRMVLAAELDEGARLNTSTVKQLASIDYVRAEPKYRDPFSFRPSHSLILYTNHLPKVGARDSGTWDRLILIPFNARFRNAAGEIKNYADHLYKQCGGAVLSWMIEGARRYIASGCMIEFPDAVKNAIAEYRQNNDWMKLFIDECCIVSPPERVAAGELYKAYRAHCETIGEYARRQDEFKAALLSAGYTCRKTNKGAVYFGLRLKDPAEMQRDAKAAERSA